MKVIYNLENFSKLKNQHNEHVHYRYLPFSMNYWMFNNLVNLNRPLTLSEQYDKYFLLAELWSRMCSQVLEEYMQKEFYYGR